MGVLKTWYSFCTRIKCMNGSEIFAVTKDYHLYNGYDIATTTSDLPLPLILPSSGIVPISLILKISFYLQAGVSTEVDSVSCFQDNEMV